jgi:hypothetical protein
MPLAEKMSPDTSARRTRLWLYWGSAISTTFVFLFFMATMLMVPGMLPSTKICLLSVVGVAAMVALGIGTWRFSSTEAPSMMWPFGTVMAVFLILELLYCIISVLSALLLGMRIDH